MLRRSLSALFVTAVAATGALVATPANAAVAGDCNLTIPTRIVISSPIAFRAGYVTGDCVTSNQFTEGYWLSFRKGSQSRDEEDATGFAIHFHDSRTADPSAFLLVDGNSVTWGKTTFEGLFAGVGCDEETGACKTSYTQNAPVTDVRLASKSVISGKRAKGVTTLVARSKVYAPYAGQYRARITHGRFQSRTPGGEWQTIRNSTTTYRGYAGMTVRGARAGLQYRFVTNQAAHWWGSSSGVVTR